MSKRKLRKMYRRYLFSYTFEVFAPSALEYAWLEDGPSVK